MNLPNGHLLQNGKYRLTHFVGQGGFGITYKGVWFTEVKGSLGTVKTEVPIAIKEYFFKDYCYREETSYAVKVHSETGKNIFDKFKEKLIREARILSDVHHPNVVNVLEVFEENNTAYIAMEYISGLSLKEMMEREGILSEAKVLKYVHQIGDALQFVHDNNILHLDIKPSNILIDRKDNARLIDFGVSKRYDTPQQETSTTMLTLSKGFASIEQYDNEGTQNFSPYPDVYSLGATMYNLLTGKIPVESILRATRPLPEPAELNPEISSKTESVIMKAMEVVPADRYQTVKEMMNELNKPPTEELKAYGKADDSHPFSSEGGDTTLIYPSGKSKLPVEDENEQTLLNDPVEEADFPWKKKKGLSRILLWIVFLLVAGAIIFIFYHEGQKVENGEKESPVIAKQEDTTENKMPQVVDTPTDTTDNRDQESLQPSQQATTEEPVLSPREEPTVTDNSVNVPTEQPEETDRNAIRYATFDSLMASGKKREQREDLGEALADFRKANDYAPRDSLLELGMKINEIEQKIKAKDISDREALYEKRDPFGNLTIVREKSTGKFGAINRANAKVVIPCNYLFHTQAGEYFAFAREGGLFDIYNSDGKLIKEGETNFN